MFRLPRPLGLARDAFLALIAVAAIAIATVVLLLDRLRSRAVRPGRAPSRNAPCSTTAASIIVNVENGDCRADDCLRAVMDAISFDGVRHEVIVIGQGAAQHGRQLGHGEASIHYLQGAGAHAGEPWKMAASTATNDVIVLLGSDTTVERGFLRPLLDCFKDPLVFAAAAHPLGVNEEAAASSGRARGELRGGEIHLWQAPRDDVDRGCEPVLWASRRASAFHRARFLRLGGFNPLYGDAELADADLCFRAWQRGWQVVLQPKSVVRVPASRPGLHQCHPDVAARDRIIFHWSCLHSARGLLRYHAALAVTLLLEAILGQLNLRPLRYAITELPRFLALGLAHGTPAIVSEEEVLRISSNRLLFHGRGQTTRTREPRQRASGQPSETRVSAAADTEEPLRILLVFPQLPYPPTHGGAVRMWNEMKTLAARHCVDVLSFAEPCLDSAAVATSVDQMKRFCRRVHVVVRKPVATYTTPFDRTIHYEMFDCYEMREALLDMVEDGSYDLVQFHKTELGQYLLPKPAPLQLLVEHVIFYRAYRRQFVDWRKPKLHRLIEYLKLRHHELEWCRKFDAVLTMSKVDAEFLRRRLPSHRWILEGPNGVSTEHFRFSPVPAECRDLLFIGNFDHSPNVDGVRFFLREVYPSLKVTIPSVRLFIVGPGRYDTLEEVAAEPSVVPTGLVEDTRPYMERCSVFVAPILAGSGTRVKILEAMAAGIPVVSTTVGAEGIEAVHGEHILLADDPKLFAESVARLQQDQALRERLRINARALVETKYRWQVIGERLESIYRELLRARYPTRSVD